MIPDSNPYERLRNEILSCRILIVEDDFLSRTVLREIFRREGFSTIEEAENGKIGLEKLHAFRPDIVVSDIMMPEMDGFELCRRIRQDRDPSIARLPILIQTALAQDHDKTRIFEAGATDYLTKPVDAREVIARSIVYLEREIVLRRLRKFNAYLARERGDEAKAEDLEGEFWSFKRLSMTINVLMDEIELSHYDLKQAKEKAEQANRLKTEFLASITHDLKTPVHCIVNFAQMGAADCDKGKTASLKEHFTDIFANGRRLDMLISDILDFSKIETGNMEFSLKPHSAREIVESALKSIHALTEEKHLRVTIDDQTDSTQVTVDARRAEQVFVNLMSNAIRFSPENGNITWRFRHTTMTIDGTEVNVPAVSITIEDEGPGIPENAFEQIFEPFVQGRQVQIRGGGNGLGLTICRRLLRAFYGTIKAGNVPGGGAMFEVLLPLYQPTKK